MDIKTYEIIVEYDDTTGMLRNSFVNQPAVEINKFTFSKQKEEIKLVFDKQGNNQCFMSVSILADTPIRRTIKGEDDFNVVFSKDSVRRIANKLAMDGRGNEVSWQHTNSIISNVYLVEQFIIEEGRVTSPIFKDVPEGSLIQTYWVKDTAMYDKLANDPDFGGFSIEIEAKIKEIMFSKTSPVTDESIVGDIHSILNEESLSDDEKYTKIDDIVKNTKHFNN
jgi:hypothetical protein